MSGTTRVLLAHLPLLLNCSHLCMQGWDNMHNFCCSCSLLNYYSYQNIAALFVSFM